MDPTGATSLAPPVVAVMVVYEPGDWFAEVLDALGEQDYPNLSLLFLVTGDPGDVPTQIRERLPHAYVRAVAANPGFGPAANQALRLVEGSGLFCFLHDDVALHPDAIRQLVEELYRSNAGIVGPKLVSWDDSRILQHVGLGIDRFGEVDPFVEPGEMDQEQHDAVRDVFCLPSACLLVRADLFRTLEGFHPGIEFYGDDLDLCWRAHLSGARVLVVPAAVARHQERLPERRPDLRHRGLAARNRMQNVATLTGRWRTPLVLLQSLILSVLQTVVGLVTGRFRNGVASFVATLGVLPRLPAVLARRRSVKPLRLVPDREVVGLQVRGSARLALFMRQHQRVTEHVADGAAPIVRSGSRIPLLVALVLGAVLIIGSRGLIRSGIPDIGQFVDIPLGKDALHRYFVGWNGQGFGSAAAPATGLALVGFASSLSFGQLGFLQLVLVIGPIAVGYLGAWRMVAFFPSVRARAGAVIVYAAAPLPYAAVAAGRWGVLAVYAATPWAIYLICRVSGLTTVDGRAWGDDDIADAVVDVSLSRRITHFAALTLLAAAVSAFVPAFLLVVLLVAGALVLGTVLARGSWSILVGAAMAALAVLGAVLLNLPWSAELLGSDGWGLVADPELAGPRNLGILNLASFRIGHTVLGSLALGLYLPVLAAPLLARGWRLTWAARAGALTAGIGLLAVLDDGGALPFRLPEAGILLVPVACGLALAGACAIAAFEHDIRGARFGWRQPLGLVVGLCVLVGLLPGLVGAANGRWSAQTIAFRDYLQQLPAAMPTGAEDPGGDYRILFVGEPRSLPAPGRTIAPGVAYAILDDGEMVVDNLWGAQATQGDELTVEALTALSSFSTARVGRLLGPLGFRFVVVPVDDGTAPSEDQVPPVPDGLVAALSAQLDLRLVDSPDKLVIYENTSWLPVRSMLDATAVAASNEASAAVRVATPLGQGTPLFIDVPADRVAAETVPAGTVHLSEPINSGWRLQIDGTTAEPRSAFGWSVAWDLTSGGQATLERIPSGGRRIAVAIQLVLWALVLIAVRGGAFSGRGPLRRSPPVDQPTGPLLDLDLLNPRVPVGGPTDDEGGSDDGDHR